MIILISPAKRMIEVKPDELASYSKIQFPEESKLLVSKLRTFNPNELSKLMKINLKLAELNHQRFKNWTSNISEENGHPALMAFNGDVYRGINVKEFSKEDLEFSQNHLRILSGLYGIIKPLDLILPYRLEMGTKLGIQKNKNLYSFWGGKLTDQIKMELKLQKEKVVINLASKEYAKAINFDALDAEIITPDFKELKEGEYKFFSVFGKYARGLMVSYMVKNRIQSAEQIKLFDTEGYFYNDQLSTAKNWFFTREYGKNV